MKRISSRSESMNPDELIEGKLARILLVLTAGSVIPHLPFS
jgi:hypothetical protein